MVGKRKLFGDDEDGESGEDVSFKESEYAKKYNTLRRKEELLKLKNKYGDRDKDSESSSSSEDEGDDVTFTQEFERDFFKTLSCLKNRDPRIYDKSVRFFGEGAETVAKQNGQSKRRPVTIRDYNRELVLNEFRESSDDEEGGGEKNKRPASPSHVEEQNEIKKIFSDVINNDTDDDDDGGNEQEKNKLGGLFNKKQKTKAEEEEEERGYHEWLAGEAEHLKNNSDESDLKPLKDYWSNPKLDEDEAFLRDYVLNERFKEPRKSSKIPSYEEIVQEEEDISEDEKTVGKQTEFEHKFNFRFEEPDQDFIKQYPRTLEHSMRIKDNKRAKKRAEVKTRKVEEKQQKREELKQLKSLKLKEIQEKIVKLKEITGNDQLAFDTEDIEGDFDPDAHDRRMQELFNEEYYGDEADAKKPEFPDLDEELEIENWEEWDENNDNAEPHCEDEDFNMDCDYDPKQKKSVSLLDELKDSMDGKKRKKRKRKGQLSEVLLKEKPIFDPNTTNKTLSQYIDEYYKLDCEDIIGDMPCRFKYREVPACNYGLTLEEILLADDKELNRWYPLKKTLQYRPEHLQINDQKMYSKKATDVNLKKKILPSLFKTVEEEPEPSNESAEAAQSHKKKKKKKKRKNREDPIVDDAVVVTENQNDQKDVAEIEPSNDNAFKTKKRKNRDKDLSKEGDSNEIHKSKKQKIVETITNDIGELEGGKTNVPTKKKHKKKKESNSFEENNHTTDQSQVTSTSTEVPEKKKKKSRDNDKQHKNENFKAEKKIKKNKKQKFASNDDNSLNNLTDERLKAYGLNPKKYRGFMKFKKY